MRLKEITVVLAIAKYRSITKAAKELFISQPALSMYLNSLETQLGAPLFDRQEKPLKLTSVGELYIRKAMQIMLIKSEFDMELSQILSTHPTSITIALQALRVPHFEPPLRAALHEKFPQMQLTIEDGICVNLIQLLAADKTDFLIINNSPLLANCSEFAIMPVLSDELLLTVSKKHPLAKKYARVSPKPPVDLRLFEKDTFLLNEPGSAVRYMVEAIVEMQGLTHIQSETHPRTELNVAFSSQGRGVAFLFSSYRPYMRHRAIDYFPVLHSEEICCDLVLVYKKDRFSSEFASQIQAAAIEAAGKTI